MRITDIWRQERWSNDGDEGVWTMTTGMPFSLKRMFEKASKDPVTEGKKSGYKRAAQEYQRVYVSIKNRYERLNNKIDCAFRGETGKFADLNKYLISLEAQRKALENEIDKRRSAVLDDTGTLGGAMLFSESLFELLLEKVWKRKFDKAEIEGYTEAKELYEEKLQKLKAEFECQLEEKKKRLNNQKSINRLVVDSIKAEIEKISELKLALADFELAE